MIPKFVMVGTQKFEIHIRDERDDMGLMDSFGYTTNGMNLIVMRKGMSIHKTQQTLLHEILHAIRFTYASSNEIPDGWDFEQIEHHFIGLYEQPLLAVLKQNPEILDFLMREK